VGGGRASWGRGEGLGGNMNDALRPGMFRGEVESHARSEGFMPARTNQRGLANGRSQYVKKLHAEGSRHQTGAAKKWME